MAQVSTSGGGGIGFAGLLAILFIVLKLWHKIDWPWLWVLSPIWIPVTLVVALFIVVFVITVIKETRSSRRRDKVAGR